MQNVHAATVTQQQLALAWSVATIPLLAGVIQILFIAMKPFH